MLLPDDITSEETSAEASLEGSGGSESEDTISVQTAVGASAAVDSEASTEIRKLKVKVHRHLPQSFLQQQMNRTVIFESVRQQTAPAESESAAGITTVTGPERRGYAAAGCLQR